MKKLILIISLFIFGNSYGQTLTINNNTTNTFDLDYIEITGGGTCPQSNFTIAIGASASVGPIGLVSGAKFMYAVAFETAGGVRTGPVSQVLASLPPAGCSISGGIFSANCPFTTPCVATWTEDSAGNVTIDIN